MTRPSILQAIGQEGLPWFTSHSVTKLSCICHIIGNVTLKASIGTTVQMPYLWVISLQLIWRSGTWVPDLQMSCSDVTTWQGTRTVTPAMTTRWHASLERSSRWLSSSVYHTERFPCLHQWYDNNWNDLSVLWSICHWTPYIYGWVWKGHVATVGSMVLYMFATN